MTAGRPKITVGLPVYNGQNYVAEAIESLLAQTCGDFELVISDNASTDATESICRAYAARDPRIRYHRQEVNRGAIWNFNHVFALADGEYFKWAAHDDLCAPNFLERCLEVLQRSPDVLWCFSRHSHIDPWGRTLPDPESCDLSYVAEPQGGPPRRTPWTRSSALPWQRFTGVLLGGTSCLDNYGLVRTTGMRKTGLLRPYYGSEKVFVAELCLQGRYAEVPETLFFVRVHPGGSGALPTAAQQQAFVDPSAAGRHRWTRFLLLRAYLQVIRRAELPAGERIHCLGALFRYVFQAHKWGRVLRSMFRGTGVGGGYLDAVRTLQDPAAPQPDSAAKTRTPTEE
jgi:glycosyltransferase involved in cell wall biosynthesis